MSGINLLPWRAERRKQRQKEFFSLIGLGLFLTVAILFFVHSHIEAATVHQEGRNRYLQSEISKLDKKIGEIDELEAKKKRLLAKMDIIQQLQSSRPEIVHLFDELSRTIPEGVYLLDLTQSEKGMQMNGIAQSNARVSDYMRNLEASKWLKEPQLNIIESKPDKQQLELDRRLRGSRFTLQVRMMSDKGDQTEKTVKKTAKPAAKPGKKSP